MKFAVALNVFDSSHRKHFVGAILVIAHATARYLIKTVTRADFAVTLRSSLEVATGWGLQWQAVNAWLECGSSAV